MGVEACERVLEDVGAVPVRFYWWGLAVVKSGVRKDGEQDKRQSELNVMDSFWVHNICQSTAGWMVLPFADDQSETVSGCDTAECDV